MAVWPQVVPAGVEAAVLCISSYGNTFFIGLGVGQGLARGTSRSRGLIFAPNCWLRTPTDSIAPLSPTGTPQFNIFKIET